MKSKKVANNIRSYIAWHDMGGAMGQAFTKMHKLINLEQSCARAVT